LTLYLFRFIPKISLFSIQQNARMIHTRQETEPKPAMGTLTPFSAKQKDRLQKKLSSKKS